MSELAVFSDANGAEPTRQSGKHADIAEELASVGVRFERWEACQPVSANDSHEAILAAYRQEGAVVLWANVHLDTHFSEGPFHHLHRGQFKRITVDIHPQPQRQLHTCFCE